MWCCGDTQDKQDNLRSSCKYLKLSNNIGYVLDKYHALHKISNTFAVAALLAVHGTLGTLQHQPHLADARLMGVTGQYAQSRAPVPVATMMITALGSSGSSSTFPVGPALAKDCEEWLKAASWRTQ